VDCQSLAMHSSPPNSVHKNLVVGQITQLGISSNDPDEPALLSNVGACTTQRIASKHRSVRDSGSVSILRLGVAGSS